MAIKLKPVDVAVIGLGAAGGVAVLPLARAGLKIAGIEAGGWMSAKDFHADEIFNNVRGLVTSVQKANREIPTVRDGPSSPNRGRGTLHPMMNAIGGTSIHYWASSWRLKPWDFKTRTEVEKRYGARAIPAASTLEDWPISYDDLEPYYDHVEHEVGVSGKAGNIQGKLDPLGNVYEGPRQREYPMPPLRSTEYTEHMRDAAKKLGWKPFPGSRSDQLAGVSGPSRLRVSRLLRTRRMPSQRQELNRRFHHSGRDEDQESHDLRSRARNSNCVRRGWQGHRGPIFERRERVLPAGSSSLACFVHLRKYAVAAALQIEGLSEWLVEQP